MDFDVPDWDSQTFTYGATMRSVDIPKVSSSDVANAEHKKRKRKKSVSAGKEKERKKAKVKNYNTSNAVPLVNGNSNNNDSSKDNIIETPSSDKIKSTQIISKDRKKKSNNKRNKYKEIYEQQKELLVNKRNKTLSTNNKIIDDLATVNSINNSSLTRNSVSKSVSLGTDESPVKINKDGMEDSKEPKKKKKKNKKKKTEENAVLKIGSNSENKLIGEMDIKKKKKKMQDNNMEYSRENSINENLLNSSLELDVDLKKKKCKTKKKHHSDRNNKDLLINDNDTSSDEVNQLIKKNSLNVCEETNKRLPNSPNKENIKKSQTKDSKVTISKKSRTKKLCDSKVAISNDVAANDKIIKPSKPINDKSDDKVKKKKNKKTKNDSQVNETDQSIDDDDMNSAEEMELSKIDDNGSGVNDEVICELGDDDDDDDDDCLVNDVNVFLNQLDFTQFHKESSKKSKSSSKNQIESKAIIETDSIDINDAETNTGKSKKKKRDNEQNNVNLDLVTDNKLIDKVLDSPRVKKVKKNASSLNVNFEQISSEKLPEEKLSSSPQKKLKKEKKVGIQSNLASNNNIDNNISEISTSTINNSNASSKLTLKNDKKSNCSDTSALGGVVESPSSDSLGDPKTKSKLSLNSPHKKKFNLSKLSQMLKVNEELQHNIEKKKAPLSTIEALKLRMTVQLNAARFRLVNEQLYTTTGYDAKNIFIEDPEAFSVYHMGYQAQVAKWPLDPLSLIINWLKEKPNEWVIADFGCGDARLCRSVTQLKVHSLDLVAANPKVIACDMANTPIVPASCDVVVFCLSLMGTNIRDFILEANRVMKMGGILKIAEVESRFTDVKLFKTAVEKYGFHSTNINQSNKYFWMFDFKKTSGIKKVNGLPTITLNPCTYKKR